jgi:hypothetical protein
MSCRPQGRAALEGLSREADDLLLGEHGYTFVLEAGDKYVELAKNSLDDDEPGLTRARAGTLLMRTQTRLYRIG